MNIGMLWFDNTPRDLTVKIRQAAEYYQKKYGKHPNLCFVHPSMLSGEIPKLQDIQVRTAPTVLPGHFWLGVENQPEGQLTPS